MEVKEEKFSKTDCWIFLSIPQTETGGNLEKLLDIADAINHAIPDRQEIETAINKGLKSKILTQNNDRFVLTPKFQQFIDGAFQQNGSPLSLIDILHDKMLDWPDETMPCESFKLTEAELDKAHSAFIKSFSEAYKNFDGL